MNEKKIVNKIEPILKEELHTNYKKFTLLCYNIINTLKKIGKTLFRTHGKESKPLFL